MELVTLTTEEVRRLEMLQALAAGTLRQTQVAHMTFAAEKLLERHALRIDHKTLRRAMIAARLWKPKARPHRRTHPPRERRPCFGELAQIDGSPHDWFEGLAPKRILLVDVDDATSKTSTAFFWHRTHLGQFAASQRPRRTRKRPPYLLTAFLMA